MRPCLKIKSINSAAATVHVVICRCEFALWWCPGRLFVVQHSKWVRSVGCGLGLTRFFIVEMDTQTEATVKLFSISLHSVFITALFNWHKGEPFAQYWLFIFRTCFCHACGQVVESDGISSRSTWIGKVICRSYSGKNERIPLNRKIFQIFRKKNHCNGPFQPFFYTKCPPYLLLWRHKGTRENILNQDVGFKFKDLKIEKLSNDSRNKEIRKLFFFLIQAFLGANWLELNRLLLLNKPSWKSICTYKQYISVFFSENVLQTSIGFACLYSFVNFPSLHWLWKGSPTTVYFLIFLLQLHN